MKINNNKKLDSSNNNTYYYYRPHIDQIIKASSNKKWVNIEIKNFPDNEANWSRLPKTPGSRHC